MTFIPPNHQQLARARNLLLAHRLAKTNREVLDALAAEHRFLCHADGRPCPDGCDTLADPIALATLNEAERRMIREEGGDT